MIKKIVISLAILITCNTVFGEEYTNCPDVIVCSMSGNCSISENTTGVDLSKWDDSSLPRGRTYKFLSVIADSPAAIHENAICNYFSNSGGIFTVKAKYGFFSVGHGSWVPSVSDHRMICSEKANSCYLKVIY